MLRSIGVLIVANLACIACTGDRVATTSSPAQVTRTVSGDTTVARNDVRDASAGLRSLVPVTSIGKVAGPEELMFGAIHFLLVAPDSNVWIYDSQLKALRVYNSNGAFVRQVGRAGDGPGEYSTVNGMTLLDRDKVILCMPRGPTIVRYGLDGKHLGDWKLPDLGISSSCDMLYSDTAGTVYMLTNLPATLARKPADREASSIATEVPGGGPPQSARIGGFISLTGTGALLDSMPIPYFGFSAPKLTAASSEGRRQTTNTFSPREIWGFSTHGHMIWGRTDSYSIHTLHRDGKVLRIERNIEPVPYAAAEIEETVAATTATMRCADPSWTHPEFPATKMFFRGVITGKDGRLWVQVTVPSEVIPDADVDRSPLPVPCPASRAIKRFREPIVYDVFEPSGEFIARVPIPTRAMFLAADGEFLWLRTLDQNDVQSATKFRIEPPLGRKSGSR